MEQTTCKESYTIGTGDKRVALLDYGAKANIAKSLVKRGYKSQSILPVRQRQLF
ncbi:MAG: hypothetical protein ACLS85_02530 [Coprobacillus cateniformis]